MLDNVLFVCYFFKKYKLKFVNSGRQMSKNNKNKLIYPKGYPVEIVDKFFSGESTKERIKNKNIIEANNKSKNFPPKARSCSFTTAGMTSLF